VFVPKMSASFPIIVHQFGNISHFSSSRYLRTGHQQSFYHTGLSLKSLRFHVHLTRARILLPYDSVPMLTSWRPVRTWRSLWRPIDIGGTAARRGLRGRSRGDGCDTITAAETHHLRRRAWITSGRTFTLHPPSAGSSRHEDEQMTSVEFDRGRGVSQGVRLRRASARQAMDAMTGRAGDQAGQWAAYTNARRWQASDRQNQNSRDGLSNGNRAARTLLACRAANRSTQSRAIGLRSIRSRSVPRPAPARR
jgi:hypothetical protein